MFHIPDKRIAILLLGIFILCIAPLIGALTDDTHTDTSLNAPHQAQPSTHTRGTA